MKGKHFTTTVLHADRRDSPEHGALHKPVHPSVAFGYADARELAAIFQNKKSCYAYGRQSNPTVEALGRKVTQMEQGLASVVFATGMAAISSTLLALLRSGDHVISSAFLFGNTNSMFATLQNLGVEVTFVDATDAYNVDAAIQIYIRLLFAETIVKPVTQLADLAVIGDL